MYRLLSLVAVAALCASGAAATEPEQISEGTATWNAEGMVDLKVTWQGSACEEPGEAKVTAGDETTDEVAIPTISTAEICTMQIVPVTFEGTVPVEKLTTTLAVTVLAPDGQFVAIGSIEIADAN